MYRITVTTNFRASHQLKLAPASTSERGESVTESYHTHDWKAEAAVSGEELDDNGLLFDFNKLKKILESIVCRLDGQKLEDLKCFENINASAENVARYIYDSIKSQLPKNIDLLYVEVTETPGCKARYGEKPSV